MRQNTEIHERGSADLQPMGRAATATINVETELTLGILRTKVNFTRRRVHALGHENEMVDQLLHLREHLLLFGQHGFVVRDVNGPIRKLVEALMENAHALPHLFHAHEVTIVAIAHRTNRDIELQLIVNEIGMRFAQVVIDAATTKIRASHPVINRDLFRQYTDIAGTINEDAVAGQQLLRFVEVDDHILEKLSTLVDPAGRQIARKTTDARVSCSETGARERLDQIINLFALREGVHEHRQRAHIHGERAKPQKMRRNTRQFAADHAN